MCRLFAGADPALWEKETHSLRLHGTSTSLCLEAFFWRVLDEIALRDGLTLNGLITRLYDELLAQERDMVNFTSFLRVCCGRYLALQAQGEIPSARDVPIRGLDAGAILAREQRRFSGTRPLPVPQASRG